MKDNTLSKGDNWEVSITEGECDKCKQTTLIISFDYSWFTCFGICEMCMKNEFLYTIQKALSIKEYQHTQKE